MPHGVKEMDISTVIIEALRAHPLLMSPLLLEYFLRGEEIGRMHEKGLVDSEWFGTLAAVPSEVITKEIYWLINNDHIRRCGGFYPALVLVDNETVKKV